MSPLLRKLALAIHLTCSVGWIGALLAYLALGVAAITRQDGQEVRGAWVAMELVGWYVIVPLAIASLLTGLVMALGTPWGLIRHYWVVFSLVFTLFAIVILLVHMPTVSALADLAQRSDPRLRPQLGGDLLHPGLGLGLLLVILVLNVYKPRGVTSFGRRHRARGRVASPS